MYSLNRRHTIFQRFTYHLIGHFSHTSLVRLIVTGRTQKIASRDCGFVLRYNVLINPALYESPRLLSNSPVDPWRSSDGMLRNALVRSSTVTFLQS